MVANRFYSPKAQRLVDLKFARLEVDRLTSLQQTAQREQELQQLKQVTGLTNQELIQRLHQAGFNDRNFEALQWLPLAMVAWASDGVSPAEVEAAKLLNLHPQILDRQDSIRLFEAWLAGKPSQDLCNLWEETTRELAIIQPSELHKQTGQMILEIAKRVARASGGFLGFGEISAAERDVLERIRKVYGLEGG